MASTKDAVTDFLQLGAKYELILAGLYDDLTRVDGAMGAVDRRSKESAEAVQRAIRAAEEVRASMSGVQERLAALQQKVDRQRKVANAVLSLGVTSSLVATLAF